jgi:N-acetylneuraminic acid mutarotase
MDEGSKLWKFSLELMQWQSIPQHQFKFNSYMSMCVSKSLNKVFFMGGYTDDGLVADDVYSWDLRNDRVTTRNHMPDRIMDMKFVV